MATYIVLMSSAEPGERPAGVGGVNASPKDQERQIRDGLERAGGELVKLHWTLGRYDLVAEVEFDRGRLAAQDDIRDAGDLDVANGFAYWLGTCAGMRTETLPAVGADGVSNAFVVAARCGGAAVGSTAPITPGR